MKNNSEGLKWLQGTGSSGFAQANIKSGLQELAGKLLVNISKYAKERGVIDSGKLISGNNFKTTITETDTKTELDIFMLYYADFVNKGVKGVRSSKNAPNSPYKFKNYGMSDDGRKSIMESIKRGRMIVRDVKYKKVGLETKRKEKKTKIERETDQAIYMIKRFGIKQTNYLDDAFAETFKDVDATLLDALGNEIFIKLIEP
jgi:hypothetical protein